MTENPNPATLFRKLSEAMAAVERIPKNGWNNFHKYHFATEADVSEAISKELSSRQVTTLVSSRITDVREWKTPGGKDTLITNVEATVTFACGETGATFPVTAAGTGDDPSDKGTYKGITGAVKYALLKTFLVPTGDDPENDTAGATQAAPAAAPRVAPAAPPQSGTQSVAAAFDATTVDEYVFKFGKHKGTPLAEVPASYLDWLLQQPAKEGYEAQHEEQHAMFRRELHRRDTAAA